MARFLVVGEINADLVLEGIERLPQLGHEALAERARLTLGSSSAIAASGLARLGDEVSFAGQVGDDLLGRFCLSEMRRLGIDVARVRARSDESTGVTVSLSSGRDRALVTYPGATESFALEEVPADLDADHLHVASVFLQSALRSCTKTLFRDAHRKGLTTSLDPGHDPSGEWDLEGMLEDVDLLFPNLEELTALTRQKDLPAAMRALGGSQVVVKLGVDGAAALVDGELVSVPAVEVPVRDTTGAGDSFDAGFLHAWVRRKPILDCLRYGVAAGSLSTREPGGTAAQSSLEELESLTIRSER